MKAEISWSGNLKRRNGRQPVVVYLLTPENELERAVLRMAYSGKRKVNIYENGEAEIQFTLPKGSNDR